MCLFMYLGISNADSSWRALCSNVRREIFLLFWRRNHPSLDYPSLGGKRSKGTERRELSPLLALCTSSFPLSIPIECLSSEVGNPDMLMVRQDINKRTVPLPLAVGYEVINSYSNLLICYLSTFIQHVFLE